MPLSVVTGMGHRSSCQRAAPGPVFSPKSSHRTWPPGASYRARAGRVWEQRAAFAENPCCFRPCRVFDHYILAFNSLLLFIDFDNYSGLRKRKNTITTTVFSCRQGVIYLSVP